MPVTPLHFGLGMLAKGVFPRRVSLTAFVASQVLIDVEVAYYMLVRHEYPFHRWAHTFVLGGLIGLVVGLGVVAAGRVLRAAAGSARQIPDVSETSWVPALAGGLLGGLTHPVLDGVMHEGIEPLRPFSASNPFHHAISVTVLHLGLVAMALIGGLLLAIATRRLLPQARRGSETMGAAQPRDAADEGRWEASGSGLVGTDIGDAGRGRAPLPADRDCWTDVTKKSEGEPT